MTYTAILPNAISSAQQEISVYADRDLRELISRSGVIPVQELAELVELAGDLKISLGAMLIRSGLVDQHFIELCKEALTILSAGRVQGWLVASGLKVARSKNISVASGMRYFGWNW